MRTVTTDLLTGQPIVEDDAGQLAGLLPDGLGYGDARGGHTLLHDDRRQTNVAALAASTGTLLEVASYDVWGEVVSRGGPTRPDGVHRSPRPG